MVSTSVSNWEQAAQLDPSDPLPPHLLGSFVFVTCGLPWVAARALRGLSPGLKKYTFDDALKYLLESERLQPSPPYQYSVTNRSMIGRIYAQQGAPGWLLWSPLSSRAVPMLRAGDKVQAKKWLAMALNDEISLERMDPTAKAAREAAEKVILSL